MIYRRPIENPRRDKYANRRFGGGISKIWKFEGESGEWRSILRRRCGCSTGWRNGGRSSSWKGRGYSRKGGTTQKKRIEKAKPLEVGLDSGGGFPMENMSGPSLENTTEAHLAVLGNFRQQEDVKLYGHLPGYGDFQRYDLGQADILHQVAQRMYANFHKPSWGTLKHHLFSVNAPKKIFRGLKSLARNDKGRFETRTNVWQSS